MKTVLLSIEIDEFQSLIESSVERVLLKRQNEEKTSKVNQKSTLENIVWFSEQIHKEKSTVYSDLSRGKIPKCLIHKPKGAKYVLFYKDRVLQWIELGCPAEFTLNEKGGNDEN